MRTKGTRAHLGRHFGVGSADSRAAAGPRLASPPQPGRLRLKATVVEHVRHQQAHISASGEKRPVTKKKTKRMKGNWKRSALRDFPTTDSGYVRLPVAEGRLTDRAYRKARAS